MSANRREWARTSGLHSRTFALIRVNSRPSGRHAVPVLRLAAVAVAGLLAVGGVLQALMSEARPSPAELLPGTPYVIDVAGDSTEFDLPFGSAERYLLIVSNLNRAHTDTQIQLAAEPIDHVAQQPFRRLEPLQPQPLEPVRLPAAKRESIGHERLRLTPPLPKGGQGGLRATSDSQFLETQTRTVLDSSVDAPSHRPRTFHLHVTDGPLEDPRQYTSIESRVVAEGREIRVYLDAALGEAALCPGLLHELVAHFDDLLPRFRRNLGDYRDVDGDGRFAVLLTPWLGRLQGGRTSLGGFVRPSDFRTDLAAPLSNRCDMLYLNTDLRPGPSLRTLLAHEFAHAVCFSVRRPEGGPRLPDQDDWLNEAVAHLAENLHGDDWSNLDYRISRFLTEPGNAPLVVPDYYRAGLWRDHGCRGATYLFLRWCVDQYGEALLPRLIRSPHAGTGSLELATGERFDDLFRQWAVALAASAQSSNAPTTHAAARFKSLDLHAPLAGWQLCGPQIFAIDVEQPAPVWPLKGTSSLFLELRASHATGPMRIRLVATPGSKLQVTLIPRSPDGPALTVQCEAPAPATCEGTLNVHVAASTRHLRIETIACEQNAGEAKRSRVFHADELDDLRRSRPGPPTSGSESFQLPVPSSWPHDEPVLVKTLARDNRGRRITAWAVQRL